MGGDLAVVREGDEAVEEPLQGVTAVWSSVPDKGPLRHLALRHERNGQDLAGEQGSQACAVAAAQQSGGGAGVGVEDDQSRDLAPRGVEVGQEHVVLLVGAKRIAGGEVIDGPEQFDALAANQFVGGDDVVR